MFETKDSNMTKMEIEMETQRHKYETDAKIVHTDFSWIKGK